MGAGLPPPTAVAGDEVRASGLGPGALRGLRMGAVTAALGCCLMALGLVTQPSGDALARSANIHGAPVMCPAHSGCGRHCSDK